MTIERIIRVWRKRLDLWQNFTPLKRHPLAFRSSTHVQFNELVEQKYKKIGGYEMSTAIDGLIIMTSQNSNRLNWQMTIIIASLSMSSKIQKSRLALYPTVLKSVLRSPWYSTYLWQPLWKQNYFLFLPAEACLHSCWPISCASSLEYSCAQYLSNETLNWFPGLLSEHSMERTGITRSVEGLQQTRLKWEREMKTVKSSMI